MRFLRKQDYAGWYRDKNNKKGYNNKNLSTMRRKVSVKIKFSVNKIFTLIALQNLSICKCGLQKGF